MAKRVFIFLIFILFLFLIQPVQVEAQISEGGLIILSKDEIIQDVMAWIQMPLHQRFADRLYTVKLYNGCYRVCLKNINKQEDGELEQGLEYLIENQYSTTVHVVSDKIRAGGLWNSGGGEVVVIYNNREDIYIGIEVYVLAPEYLPFTITLLRIN